MDLKDIYLHLKNFVTYADQQEALELPKEEARTILQFTERQLVKRAKIEAAGEKTISGYCPTCGEDLVYIKYGYRPTMRSYCKYCGQHILWDPGE